MRPKAESKRAVAEVTVELERYSNLSEVHVCGYSGKSAARLLVSYMPLALKNKQQHYKRRLFACSKHAIDAPIDGALNKTRAPAPRNNPRGPAFDASTRALKNDGPDAP